MAQQTEGVIAIHKPPHVTSADVLRTLSHHFNPSAFFRPWLAAERDRLRADKNSRFNKRNRFKRRDEGKLKMGHGGTLDPAASGVLVVGIGSGTKALGTFLDCTKSYECVVLFGAATDSYDDQGKVIGRKPTGHIRREEFEGVLERFRGRIKQKPPIFSALKMDGKKLYEYAREGKEPPRKIEEREVYVKELVCVEWLEGGAQGYRWPELEAEQSEKDGALKLLETEGRLPGESGEDGGASDGAGDWVGKRKRSDKGVDAQVDGSPDVKKAKAEPPDKDRVHEPPSTAEAPDPTEETTTKQPLQTSPRSTPAPPPPAARLRMTVSGGFYVRSLCHDLGLAMDSFGLMTNLARTRQGDFSLSDPNILQYCDLEAGEAVWAPKVETMLARWRERDQS